MKLYAIIIFVFLGLSHTRAQKLEPIKTLSGHWSFSVGDDLRWKLPQHDFSSWDRIYTGGNWEHQGYEGYNGYAWYKKRVNISAVALNEPLFLKIDRIDDADEVYFNGTLIGHSGTFPPNVETAYEKVRKYEIPSYLINPNGEDVIAIRVYDAYLDGGILGGVSVCKDAAQSYLLLDLSGKWKFKTGNESVCKDYSYDDNDWEELNVPERWDTQGYEFYDGYAWYRRTFNWNKNVPDEGLVVVLGRIDDKDKVYLNGKKIGSINQLKSGPYDGGKPDHQALRAYYVPKSSLHQGINVLAVLVFDEKYDGGIYEGPVGIMTVRSFENYFFEYEKKRSLFDFLLESLFD